MMEIPVPEPPADPASAKASLLQRLQPLLTLFIAIAAIGLALWEGAENRRHNRLSVQPRIGAEINIGQDNAGEFVQMTIESTGLGPAVINAFRVYLDGVVQDTTAGAESSVWQNVLEAFGTEGTQINAHAIGSGYYLAAGRQHVLFEARRPQSDSSLSRTLERVALQVCYCSIYETDCEEVILSVRRVQALSCSR